MQIVCLLLVEFEFVFEVEGLEVVIVETLGEGGGEGEAWEEVDEWLILRDLVFEEVCFVFVVSVGDMISVVY